MRLFILFIICNIIFSCNKPEEQPPIGKEKLVDILVDVHIAEAALQEYSGVTRDSIGKAYYKKLFSLHQVTEEDFNKSMYYLKQDPIELDALYKEVLAEIERREKGQ